MAQCVIPYTIIWDENIDPISMCHALYNNMGWKYWSNIWTKRGGREILTDHSIMKQKTVNSILHIQCLLGKGTSKYFFGIINTINIPEFFIKPSFETEKKKTEKIILLLHKV